MKYRIGEISMLLGIAPETLRFFEAKGIVSPRHDPKTSYRYYDCLDVNKLVAYLGYRRMGFSLDNAIALVSKCRLERLEADLERRGREIEAERERLGRIQEAIERLATTLQRREELDGDIDVVDTGPLVFFSNQENSTFKLSERDIEATRSWLEALPEATPLALLDTASVPWDVQWGFSRPYDARDRLPTDSRLIPASTCVRGFFWIPADDPDLREARAAMERRGAEEGLELAMGMRGAVLHETARDGGTYWLYELRAPVESRLAQ